MSQAVLRFVRNLLIALGVALASTLGLGVAWTAIGGGDLPVHGWIALLLGIFGTVGLAWALMALAFKSSREGWDDRVDNRLDPGRGDRDNDDKP
jgi:predicted exporter